MCANPVNQVGLSTTSIQAFASRKMPQFVKRKVTRPRPTVRYLQKMPLLEEQAHSKLPVANIFVGHLIHSDTVASPAQQATQKTRRAVREREDSVQTAMLTPAKQMPICCLHAPKNRVKILHEEGGGCLIHAVHPGSLRQARTQICPMQTRKTKIVSTLGAATRDPQVLRELLRKGVDVCRINCSHSDAQGIRTEIAHIRRAAAELDQPVAILLDLQGPKIRVGKMKEPLVLGRGALLEIVMDKDLVGEGTRCGSGYLGLANEVHAGQKVLFADGALSGVVDAIHLEKTPPEVHIRMKVGGKLGSHKGMNLPGAALAAPCLTEKDRADLVVGIEGGVDYVALSFVRRPEDVSELKEILIELGHPEVPVISKIERQEAVENIDAILAVTDGIMVARGDLGVELPLETIPIHQKSLIRAANRQGRLVITATQMLDSMERSPRPTRAETTDVANAVLDGTDAIMLSGETAAGLHPVEAVKVMDRIAREVEQSEFFCSPDEADLPVHQERGYTIAHASIRALQDGSPLVVFTWSGLSAIVASKFRPSGPLYALAPSQAICDRLALAWGVRPFRVPKVQSTDELIEIGERILLEKGLLERGQRVVVLAGSSPMKGATNLMKILVAGEEG